MPQLCPELTSKLASLKQLKQQFDLEFTKIKSLDSKKSDNLIFIRETKIKLEQGLAEFSDLFWPFENTELNWENFETQYESQKNLLIKTGLLKKISTGELGIKAIDKKEYPILTLEQIKEMMLEKRDFFKTKINQGFVKLALVPFGLPISSLIKAYDKALTEHHQQGKLLDTKNQPLMLTEEPIKDWAGFVEAETTGDLVYFPQAYSKTTHQGKTKQELLSNQAWQVLLLEDLPDLPPEGQGKIIDHRQQPEANQSPNNYLKQLQTNPQYKGEQGLTPESWITYALGHLEQTNQVIDNYEGSGKACYLLSIFFKETGGVPNACFSRSLAEVGLVQRAPGDPNPDFAGRFGVSIS
ncbi:MAG: hypothetical protein WCW02_01135 [Candidatus Buchananbacteria bacterium]